MPCFNHRVDPEGGGPYVGVVSAYIEEVELELDVEDEELLLPPAALSFSSTPFSKRRRDEKWNKNREEDFSEKGSFSRDKICKSIDNQCSKENRRRRRKRTHRLLLLLWIFFYTIEIDRLIVQNQEMFLGEEEEEE